MIKKIFSVFLRDLKAARRDAMLLYIIIAPLLLAVGVYLFAPGLNDTSVKLALLENDSPEHIEYLEDYTKIEIFESVEEMEQRIAKRDDIIGFVQKGDSYEMIIEGNELQGVQNYANALQALYELGAVKEDTNATLQSFGQTVPPLKTMLTNMLILMIVMLSGMIIAFGLVEEKADNTINAVNVSTITQTGFVIGKCLMGGFVSLISIVISLIITGYWDTNWLMIMMVGISSMTLAMIIGFLQGLNSNDIIEAASGVKLLMVPIAGSIAGYELLAENWQWTMYWSPFYWAYKANDMILSDTAQWSSVLMCVGLVILITLIVYIIFLPKLRKGLS